MVKLYILPIMKNLRDLFPAIILLIALSFTSGDLYATHVMGGNITYRCTGPNTFEIELRLYRDCSPGTATLPASLSIQVSGTSCPATVSLTRIIGPGNDITPLCPGWPSPCQSPNPAIPIGVEEHIYRGVMTVSPSCTNWTLSYSLCCRNSDITNGQKDQNFYISTQLQTGVTPCNSSPQFANPPVPFICIGQEFNFNHGAIDPDGDSMSFSIVPCRISATGPVSYVTGLSATQPFHSNTPITIDPRTGNISLTPSINQIGVICVKVEEWRNGVKIGEVIRDIQIIAVNCTNDPPTASPISHDQNNWGPNFDTAICPGQTLSFKVFSKDPTPFQSITMSWNQGISGATFNITPGQYPIGTFLWTPTAQNVGFHFFTVTVKDDGCPLVSQNTFAYSIEVRDPYISIPDDVAICDGEAFTLGPNDVFSTVDFDQFMWIPQTGVNPSNSPFATFTPNVSTTYTLAASNGFCHASDTMRVHVDQRPVVSIGNTPPICLGDSATITLTGTAAAYDWNTGATGTSIKVGPTQTTTYIVTGRSNFGCVRHDTVTLVVNPLPVADAGLDKQVCSGENVVLDGSGTGPTYRWEPAGLVPDPNVAQAVASPTAAGNVTFTLTVTDINGCTAVDEMTLSVTDQPQLNMTPDTIINQGESVWLTSGFSGASTYLWSPDKFLVAPSTVNDEDIEVAPTEDITYTVTVTDANGCVSVDTVMIRIRPGTVHVPSAFVPNSQIPENRKFYPLASGLVTLEYFRVYNRWGQMLFESYQSGIDTGWDGTFKGEEMPPGVYTWVLKGVDRLTEEAYIQSGNVTLIR